jgi:hypothetical protein
MICYVYVDQDRKTHVEKKKEFAFIDIGPS